jgi:hypothetical protein
MFDLTTAAQATERDFGAVIDRLDGLADADWNTPVRCRGWQVTDLAATWSAPAKAKRRACAAPPPASPTPPGSRRPRIVIPDRWWPP